MALSQILWKLENLANKLGYKIVGSRTSAILPSAKLIQINTRQTAIKRAWTIAHEIGHIVTLKKCIREVGPRVLSGATHEWPSLEAEFRAWRATDKLVRKLGIYSNKYLQYKHSCMRSYYYSAMR